MGCLAYKCLLFLCMDKRACEHTYFFHACMCMPVHTHEQQMGGFSQVLLQQTHHHCMYAGVHTMLSSIWRWRNLASIAVCRCINSWALTSKARSTVTKEQKQYYWHGFSPNLQRQQRRQVWQQQSRKWKKISCIFVNVITKEFLLRPSLW